MKNQPVFYCTYCGCTSFFEEIEPDFWACTQCDHEVMKPIKEFKPNPVGRPKKEPNVDNLKSY